MQYEYSGYLASLLEAPDAAASDAVESIVLDTAALAQWHMTDCPSEKEWQQARAICERSDHGIHIEGRFEEIRRIDNLNEDDPSFWVAVSSRNWEDPRLPVDTARFPIIEITYRCLSPGARPAWMWSYPGGEHLDWLRPVPEWRRIARLVPHRGFPAQVDGVTIRLYTVHRSTESLEIASIRFRALTAREAEVCHENQLFLERYREVPRYNLLQSFLPFGSCIMAGTAKRAANQLDVSLRDYWRLTMEDIVRHYHNSLIVEEVEEFSPGEWRELLDLAESFNIKIVAQYNWNLDHFEDRATEMVDAYIRPYRESRALLAWAISNEPPEHAFPAHLSAREQIEKADPNHPLIAIMRDPDGFPLFAPYLAVTGLSHFKSHAALDVGEIVQTHLPLCGGQQMWVVAPAYTYATDTPDWNTCPEIRLMLNLALARGARGWFTFAYHNDPVWMGGSFQRSLTGPFLTFSDLWAELGLRVERIAALSPLLLCATPTNEGNIAFNAVWQPNVRSARPRDVDPLTKCVLQGPDYCLYYLINNDVLDVAAVNIEFGESKSLVLYDVTDYVRGRLWEPMPRRRHIEMFPGQGRVILCAEPDVCERARIQIAQRMVEDDSRQIAADLGLARRYDLPVGPVQRLMQEVGMGDPLEDANRTRQARDLILDTLYASSHVVLPRSNLVEISAAICGCDGGLCRLLARGKSDVAREYGTKVFSVARELTHLRLRLREGEGRQIQEYCTDLTRRTRELLDSIRALL